MPHVLVAGRIHAVGLDLLRSTSGITTEVIDEVSTASFAPSITEADALLIRTQPLPADVIAGAARLRIVSRHGVGFEAIDVPALNTRGVTLAVVGDVNSRPVAEHTLALMLALAKRLTVYDRAVRRGDWNVRDGFSASELWGKRLFLIGFGRVGRLVCDMAKAFGMSVLAHDRYVSPERIRAAGVESVTAMSDGLQVADFVSLHLPGSSGALIGPEELALMRPDAFLVNTARGDLVDRDALVAALAARTIAGAGLDVFPEEPPPEGLDGFPNDRVIVSPHSAALTRECAVRMSRVAAQNILDFFEGRLDPALVVNQPVP